MKDLSLQLHEPPRSKSAARTPSQLPSAPRYDPDVPGGAIESFFTSLSNLWASVRTSKGKERPTNDTIFVPERTTDDDYIAFPHRKTKSSGHSDPHSKLTKDNSIATLQAAKNDFTSPPKTISDNISPSMPDAISKTISKSANSDSNEQKDSFYLKTVAPDCIVDFTRRLPTALEREWNLKVEGPLLDAISRLLPGEYVTVELVMARSSENGEAKPTVLSMCSLLEHETQIRREIHRILSTCDYVRSRIRLKVAVLEISLCTPGSSSAGLDPVPQNETIIVEISTSEAGEDTVLFGKLAKLYREKDIDSTAFSTIGGVVSVGGILYGLTTAHGIRSLGTRPQEGPRASGMKYRNVTSSILLTCWSFYWHWTNQMLRLVSRE